MRIKIHIISNLLLIIAVIYSLQGYTQSFEGKVALQYQQGGDEAIITWYIKGDRLAMELEFSGDKGIYLNRFVPEPGNQRMLLITTPPEGKPIYHYVSLEDIQPSSPNGQPLTVVPGETTVKHGLRCREVIISGENRQSTCWIATDYEFNFHRYAPFFKDDPAIQAMYFLKWKGIPVEMVTYNSNGELVKQYTLVNLQAGHIPDDVFTLPTGSEQYNPPESSDDR